MKPENSLKSLEKALTEAENVKAGLPVRLKPYLPETTKELKDFILIGDEALKAYRLKVSLIKKIGLAQDVHQQALEDGQRMGEAVLLAKAKMGDLLKSIPFAREKGGSTRGTSLRSLPEGITKKISYHTQRIAEHRDLIPQVVAKAVECGDIPSMKGMENAIREVEKQEKFKAGAKSKSVDKIISSEGENQTKETDILQAIDPHHERVIISMNPSSTWLMDIKITMDGIKGVYDIEVEWSYEDQVFKIRRLISTENCGFVWPGEAKAKLEEIAKEVSIKKPPHGFIAGLKQVRFSVSKDKDKPVMMGIYFDGSHFYSTDNYRITRLKSLEPTEDKLLIPNALLKKLANKSEPSGFCIYQGKIWFFYNDLIAFGKLLEGEFPNCKTLFETVNEKVRNEELRLVKFNKLTLKMALNRLSALRPEYPYRINVGIRPGILLLSVAGGGREVIEKVECKTDASGVFSVSLNFFEDAINATECFYFDDQKKSPIYFLSQSGLETLLLQLEVGDAEPEATLERVSKLLEEKEEKRS